VDARRSVGEEGVPFHKFAELVKGQVLRFRRSGADQVAFRLSVRDGRVNFTAKGVRRSEEKVE